MDAETLEQLQTKIAFLERGNVDLSDVVYQQQQEIQLMRRQIEAILGRLDTAMDDAPHSAEDERPPHY